MITFRQSMLAQKARINFLNIKCVEELTQGLSSEELIGSRRANRMQKIKRRLYMKQRGKCCFCEQKMYLDFEFAETRYLAATIEHVTPRAKGGTNAISNLKLSCYRCNSLRGTMNFEAFKENTQKGMYAKLIIISLAKKRKTVKLIKSLEKKIAKFIENDRYRNSVLSYIGKNALDTWQTQLIQAKAKLGIETETKVAA